MSCLSPHREGRVQTTLLAGQYQYQCLTGIIQNAAAADDAAAAAAAAAADGDAALSYDQRSVRAGPLVGPARPRPVREYSGDIKLCITDSLRVHCKSSELM